MKAIQLLSSSLIFISLNCSIALAGDISRFTGDYVSSETSTTCATHSHIDLAGDNLLVDFEACDSNPSGAITAVFSCNPTTMICEVSPDFPQANICQTATLILLSSGNILLTNPCRGFSVQRIRVR